VVNETLDASRATHTGALPQEWVTQRPKAWWRHLYDFVLAPLRMALLPDAVAEKMGLTSLRGERFAAVLPVLKGKVLDIGAGDNVLIRLHQRRADELTPAARDSVGVDVVDWGAGCVIIESSDRLPFPDESFDCVTFIACINHIPERQAALREARRVLRPGGRVVLTMIGRFLGEVGHKIWWYSEDKHRHVDEHEEMGMDPAEVLQLLRAAGFTRIEVTRFLYRLNTLYVATKCAA
jgi:SAM-dependent methyltransferase